MNSELKDWIFFGGILIAVFGLFAWFKGGGRFDSFVGIFIGLFIVLIVGIILFVIINLVRDYLANRKK